MTFHARRLVLSGLTALLLGTGALTARAEEEKVLNIYNW